MSASCQQQYDNVKRYWIFGSLESAEKKNPFVRFEDISNFEGRHNAEE